MMTRAYPEIYLSSAQRALGDAFDYAVNACRISGEDFVRFFSVSSVSRQMENGEARVLSGKSGIEIALQVLAETTGKRPEPMMMEQLDRSAEYWIGWAAAYYQWYSGRRYSEIFQALPYYELKKMYFPLHEADISKFAEIADEHVRAYYKDTNLKRMRGIYGISQAELARRSGVGLRSIQMYEQRRKDINKASAETLYSLAKVLGCTMEDLLEK